MIQTHRYHVPVSGRSHGAHPRGACPFGSEIARGIQVRMPRIAARLALEQRLARTALPCCMSTLATAWAGMPRVFLTHVHPNHGCLTPDEVQHLRTPPGLQ